MLDECASHLMGQSTNVTTTMKKALGETQTQCAGHSNVEPKIFAPPQTPFLGVQDCQNLISCTYRPSLVKIDARNFELSW